MKLIVGLGNVGEQYKKTRHNVGFVVIDRLLEKIEETTKKSKFNGDIYKNSDFILAKPHTFMNNSGTFIKQLIDFYKINIDDVLIVYDDIYTGIGKAKIKMKGSSGGHNGIASIIQQLNTQEFKRIKIGIGNEKLDKSMLSSFVLGNFSSNELTTLQEVVEKVLESILTFVYNDVKVMISKFDKYEK